MMKKAAFWLALALFIGQAGLAIFATPEAWGHSLSVFGTHLKFDLMVDSLSRAMLLCISMVLSISLLVGRYDISGEEHRFNFVNLLLIMLSGMDGVVMTTDIFSLFVFMEVTTVTSLILVALKKNNEALEAAFKYMVLSVVATILMFSAIALLLLVSGSTSFSIVQAALETSKHNFLIMFAIGIFLCGLFIKAGLMPFHAWLPDAHSAAPAAVSILLSGVQIKVLGAYTIIRLITSIFGYTSSVTYILMLVGTISIIFGALGALGQRDFKRMLAYSSISNMGYIVLGFGCGTTLGMAGAVFHLFNHAVFKSLLFLNAAAVESQTGIRDMNKMGGLASRMPLTGITSVLASLSGAGIPPLAGFWSKLIIILALWMAGYHGYALIAIAGSILTLAYFLSMQRRVFFGKLNEEFAYIKEAEFGFSLAAVILATVIVGVGLCFPLLLNTFLLPIGNIFGG
ncbi:MAG: proton-conducting transporter membrane subunit [Candidatus Omnitrophica bacterium]|nr:proton-conducting transporter membrane subunit [Candidatus Omnitrophota bacterium]MDD5593084.1 proton-conducting transporter membrane subunit [Candidatus Omnitrophota bacterium]